MKKSQPKRLSRQSICLVLSAIFLQAASMVYALELSKVKTSFENTGVDPDAKGTIKASFKPSSSVLTVKLNNLAPNSAFTLQVGGVPKAEFNTGKSGNITLTFSAPPNGSNAALDFDPRGKLISVNDGASNILEAVFSGEGEQPGSVVFEKTELTPNAIAGSGKATASYSLKKSGSATFKVEVEDVPAGSYDLFVDGVLRGTIPVVNPNVGGEIEFESEPKPSKELLDFDPRNKKIDIALGNDVYFSSTLAAKAEGVSLCEPSEQSQSITSSGVDPDGKAEARYRTREDCEAEWHVEIEDVPVGAYQLFVAGVSRGTITVAAVNAQTRGELEFTTDNSDDPDKLLLDFDPRGKLIEIRQGATVFFSSEFSPSGSVPSNCTFEEILVSLLNQGVIPNAQGDLRYRIHEDCSENFRVKLKNLPIGDYNILVAGTIEGTITVVASGGQTEGELEFDSEPKKPGEVLLDFDVRGRVVQIERGGEIYLQRAFP